nr:DUF2332 family protein [Actinoplanes sp. TFC3]
MRSIRGPSIRSRPGTCALSYHLHLEPERADPSAFIEFTLHNWEAIATELESRATQTNKPGRCALLLPILSALPQPLALLEVGASAGLNLYPGLPEPPDGTLHTVLALDGKPLAWNRGHGQAMSWFSV